ncbi:heme-binding protein [Actinoplanes sp. NPDC089786]|uniref:GlcG/HbpS family heme-binding protein n=1 Tax=Actinoplanes sp. NPDC089786 TaxID=3155185 RepID=UPI00343E96B3
MTGTADTTGTTDSANHSYRTASITLRAASDLLEAAREAGVALGFEPATAIVDPGGNLVAFERGDRTPFLAGPIAIDKAWTAVSYQVSSSYWNGYVQDPSVSPLQNLPRVMPVGGGYAIREGNLVIAAIGISGGTLEQDERAALAAIEKLGLTATDTTASTKDR